MKLLRLSEATISAIVERYSGNGHLSASLSAGSQFKPDRSHQQRLVVVIRGGLVLSSSSPPTAVGPTKLHNAVRFMPLQAHAFRVVDEDTQVLLVDGAREIEDAINGDSTPP